MADAFQSATYGDLEVGYGQNPAVLVIDFQRGFTDPAFTMGKGPHIHAARDQTVKLLDRARGFGVPIASCYTGWKSLDDQPRWKVTASRDELRWGTAALEMDPKIADAESDFIFWKPAPSIFFGTPLMQFLTRRGVDTTVITGCVTSGCVRASVIESFSYGFHTIVVDDCCGDLSIEAHEANLRDVERRYADIRDSGEVLRYFSTITRGAPAPEQGQRPRHEEEHRTGRLGPVCQGA